jgi:hypothetical protein
VVISAAGKGTRGNGKRRAKTYYRECRLAHGDSSRNQSGIVLSLIESGLGIHRKKYQRRPAATRSTGVCPTLLLGQTRIMSYQRASYAGNLEACKHATYGDFLMC